MLTPTQPPSPIITSTHVILTRWIDSVQGDLPCTDETPHLLQVTLPDVVLENDIIGETHSLQSSRVPPVPGK